MDLTLDTLLASLNVGMTKSAGEDEKDEAKEDKKDGEKKENPFAKKDEKDDKKDEDKECKDDKGHDKEASVAGAELARQIMEKVANINIESVPGMNKTASAAGKTLATALLEKLAGAGDNTTSNGVTSEGTPVKTSVDNAQLVAEDDAKVKPMQTSDGNKPTGSINQIFDAIVADAQAQGAASVDQVHTTGVVKAEGLAEKAVPHQVQEKMAAINELIAEGVSFEDAAEMVKQAEEQLAEDMEKLAAVQSLIESGVDFDTASQLVKQASDELEAEAEALTKAAAVSELVSQGVDFDKAVEMVKQAGVGDNTTSNGITSEGTPVKTTVDNAQLVAEDDAKIKPMQTSDGNQPTGSINEIFDAVIADAVAQGAASTDQVHDTGVTKDEGNAEKAVPHQVKAAALQKLMESGMDFGAALEMIKQAEAKQLEGKA